MIICSCNVLSEAQVLKTLQRAPEGRIRSAGEAYRCLGCAPRCGRCLETVRALVAKAHFEDCHVGCPSCPAAEGQHEGSSTETVTLIAAE